MRVSHLCVCASHLCARVSHLCVRASHLCVRASHLRVCASHLRERLTCVCTSHLRVHACLTCVRASHLRARASHLCVRVSPAFASSGRPLALRSMRSTCVTVSSQQVVLACMCGCRRRSLSWSSWYPQSVTSAVSRETISFSRSSSRMIILERQERGGLCRIDCEEIKKMYVQLLMMSESPVLPAGHFCTMGGIIQPAVIGISALVRF